MAFVYGLALTNHLTVALLLPGFLVFVWRYGRGQIASLPRFFRLAGWFVLPLLLYAYLPLAARFSDTPVAWSNPQSLQKFWEHVSGKQYQHYMFHRTFAEMGKALSTYITVLLPREMMLWLLLVPIGVVTLWKDRRTRPWLFLSAYILSASVFHAINYEIIDIYVYYIPSYLILWFWVGQGVLTVARWGFGQLWQRLQAPDAIQQRQARLASVVALCIPITQMSLHYAETDKSGNYLEYDFARNILHSAPQNAVVIPCTNTMFTLWYLQYVKGERPDVLVLNFNSLLGTLTVNDPWYLNHVQKKWKAIPLPRTMLTEAEAAKIDPTKETYTERVIRAAMAENRGVLYIPDSLRDQLPPNNTMLDAFARVPHGLTERIYEKRTVPSASTVFATNRDIWAQAEMRGVFTGWAHNDPLQDHIAKRYFFAQMAFGKQAEEAKDRGVALIAYNNAGKLFQSKELDAALQRLTRTASAQTSP
jgi:hypothetical protein